MSDANILLQMTLERTRLIEERIVQFLGHRPSWKERKAFRILNRLGESTIYHQNQLVGTVYYQPIDDPII
ncbi:MAG TPA: hypothetical protein VJ499_08225 [Flavisolibacter sp.]|nr:hypothetical protein [Flavisolibacter sp.]